MSPQQAQTPVKGLPTSDLFQEATHIAARHAEDVDIHARFPSEAVDALRASGALSWYVPREYGGAGANIEELAEGTFELSRRCASTGMIFAMHQIQVGSIVRHKANSCWFEQYLKRLVREQRLIASATSEQGIGGNLLRSIAALEPVTDNGVDTVCFEKSATTVSYGAHADDVLTTVRRNPAADQGDQVLVLTHISEMDNKQAAEWDTMGMRGTCSPGFVLRARCLRDQVLPVPFGAIAAETVVPFSHILWAHVWLGLAVDAFERAQNFVRAQARQNPGTPPPSALRLSELSVRMAEFRALVRGATKEYAGLADGDGRCELSTIGYTVRINNLKIAVSEAAVDICQSALRICGIAGYKNTGPFSVCRQLRDAYSAVLMHANHRILATNAAMLLIYREAK